MRLRQPAIADAGLILRQCFGRVGNPAAQHHKAGQSIRLGIDPVRERGKRCWLGHAKQTSKHHGSGKLARSIGVCPENPARVSPSWRAGDSGEALASIAPVVEVAGILG